MNDFGNQNLLALKKSAGFVGPHQCIEIVQPGLLVCLVPDDEQFHSIVLNALSVWVMILVVKETKNYHIT